MFQSPEDVTDATYTSVTPTAMPDSGFPAFNYDFATYEYDPNTMSLDLPTSVFDIKNVRLLGNWLLSVAGAYQDFHSGDEPAEPMNPFQSPEGEFDNTASANPAPEVPEVEFTGSVVAKNSLVSLVDGYRPKVEKYYPDALSQEEREFLTEWCEGMGFVDEVTLDGINLYNSEILLQWDCEEHFPMVCLSRTFGADRYSIPRTLWAIINAKTSQEAIEQIYHAKESLVQDLMKYREAISADFQIVDIPRRHRFPAIASVQALQDEGLEVISTETFVDADKGVVTRVALNKK